AAGTLGAAILRRRAEAERLQLVREQSARVEAEAAQQRLAVLAEASQILAASLDFETSLQGVADLLVRTQVDGCLFDVAGPDGSVRRIATAGTLAPKAAHELPTDQPWLSGRVLVVPLITHAGMAGSMTWIARPARAPFEWKDLDLAEHLARRCSLAIDNSRLY